MTPISPPADIAVPVGTATALPVGAALNDAAMDRRMSVAVIGFYLLDALFLGGYAALGLVPPHLPPLLALVGLLVGGASMALNLGPNPRWNSPALLSLAHTLVASFAMLGIALAAPPVAGLMMLTLVMIFPTAALRMPMPMNLALAALTAVALVAMAMKLGQSPALPVATTAQQALTVAFIFYTVAKGTGVNLVGTAWRQQLADSEARLAQALVRVESLATRDELTGLPNRRQVLDLLAAEVHRTRRTGHDFAVAMVDIDHFKRINDTHGHAAGDAVLRAFAGVAGDALRAQDGVGRLGGEEFLLLLPGPIDAEGARTVAERLRTQIERHDWQPLAGHLPVTVSLGTTLYRRGETPDALLERADRLLYEAKHQGRNQVRCG